LNPDSEKASQKISSLAETLMKNGNFGENVLYSAFKTDCRRRLQTPIESSPDAEGIGLWRALLQK